ncbi:hypothetical protein CK510_12980 [Brunnivagina elsteri CCALA 953]|uniref:Uncharacterized protein n=2 Tax=Brunnivagina TaxID=3344733 RepID=A0A2A2TIP3_9CYAN|nr:hypothetical protein CK510_12980 [Calothrix elsteri CCALA 953]
MVAIATIFAIQPASANQTNGVDGDEASQDNQTTTLATEAATINNRWGFGREQSSSLNDSVGSISVIREETCRKIDPSEILKNPGSFFRQCPVVEKNQTPELGEKIQYFQIPKLDSGIKLNLTRF